MPAAPEPRTPDWEAFYRDYRKPDYVPGFEITTKLGGGMFGLVFRARRMSIGKDYAIKFLQVEDGDVRTAVLNELEQVKYFAQIDHPNLVSIEDRGEVDGIPYLVMAFAGTETLRDKLQKRPPSADEKDELLRWYLQCCRGLAALHERSLVHFDVKPANVFLKGGVARVGDYGLSKLVTHSRGSLSMGRGTPYYMAPEMLQRRGDQRSDVYSLGVLLYEILCGEVPFTGDSEWEVLRKHESEPPALPAHLTARERAVLLRCLAKDPGARYQSVHDLIAAFVPEEQSGVVPAAAPLAPSAMQAEPPALPGCVPPPLPAVKKRARRTAVPPPLPGSARRRTAAALVGMVTVAMAVAFVMTLRDEPRRSRSRANTVATQSQRAPVDQSPAARCDRLVATVVRESRTAAQREQRLVLRQFDSNAFAVPGDYHGYRAQVDALARAHGFSTGHANKLERLGRPAVVAGVQLLLEFSYDDPEHCRRASNVRQFLGQVMAIDALAPEFDGCEPDEGDVCRFLVLADGWRRVAEQFARDDATFEEILAARGKRAGNER